MATETKHTPGPWNYTPQPVETNGYYIQSEQLAFIGEAGGGVMQKEEIKGNAKLIAAAPDLLSALQELTEVASEYYKMIFERKPPKDHYSISNALEAIKKATK